MERNEPLRILHVVGGMDKAGTETMLMNLYRNIDRGRVQFDFVSYYKEDAYYDKEIIELGGKVIKISPPQEIGIKKSIQELRWVIKKYGPYKAVHAHTLFNCGISVLAARLEGVKIRISHAHTTLDGSSNIIKKIYSILMRAIIRTYSTDLLACSERAGKFLFGKSITQNSKYAYFPNCIDYNKFINFNENTDIQKEKLKINKEHIVIGHIGRFVKAKNHEFILEVLVKLFNDNKEYTALFVGDGELRGQIEYKAKEYGIHDKIHFLGLRDDIDNMLNITDIFIFPSIYEGLGLVLLEAQASGVPCIVSNAIQPEADVGLGLMHKLDLKDSIENWCDYIKLIKKQKKIDKKSISQAFTQSGYSIKSGVNKLMQIYRI
ncbi:glycosyltransferase family 1 protein [Domibacillus sp. A3M-37]|uniref:glycosyltransferase family 1 protein n=1 Tax=Domibacillus sp. A3M-37 TaxID=2962037 RepID=UPI0020B6E602|nr:glycosyltransferase family 1 protein [Domibacillus sp. A3M-37]MCP3761403.1 glycosyltransferase family 1 protein [Domibacillus sp. A3M-37]